MRLIYAQLTCSTFKLYFKGANLLSVLCKVRLIFAQLTCSTTKLYLKGANLLSVFEIYLKYIKKVLSLKKMSYFYNTVGIPELLYRVVSAKLRCELAIESGALIMLLKISTP